ncbi:hypothetical protein OAC91_01035 [Candidatus Marinimicrobia bacterium]|nr:hypothetical protein [Candidatus Neomarinimicrobiota bacterium]
MSISEYRPFPDKLDHLNFQPSMLSWSLSDGFIILDNSKRELIELNSLGEILFSTGLGRDTFRYGDLIWIGSMPDGVNVVDRLENKISVLDFNLNPVQTIDLNLKIFPDKVISDSWGRLFMYSKTYNNIYLFENGELNDQPYINLFKEFDLIPCIKDMAINKNGEFGILDCDGRLIIFTQNGSRQMIYPSYIEKAKFIVSLRSDWFLFNEQGLGFSINEKKNSSIPKSSIPVIDIVSRNLSMAILSKDHILIMDVR